MMHIKQCYWDTECTTCQHAVHSMTERRRAETSRRDLERTRVLLKKINNRNPRLGPPPHGCTSVWSFFPCLFESSFSFMSENQIHKHLSPADSLSLYSKSCATGRAHKPVPLFPLHYDLFTLNNPFPRGLFKVITLGAAHQSAGAEERHKKKEDIWFCEAAGY